MMPWSWNVKTKLHSITKLFSINFLNVRTISAEALHSFLFPELWILHSLIMIGTGNEGYIWKQDINSDTFFIFTIAPLCCCTCTYFWHAFSYKVTFVWISCPPQVEFVIRCKWRILLQQWYTVLFTDENTHGIGASMDKSCFANFVPVTTHAHNGQSM